jgi:SAM-dependent MidA family methyltransferase
MDRKPPASVRRTLRAEVGFCCPIEGCGSPYLTYHHFDPPWASEPHHNPEGMVALCLQHHKEADVGTYTENQLRELKKTGKSHNPVAGRFNWKKESTLIIAGSNYFIGSPTILEVNKTKQIWFEKDENNNDTVNMDLYSSEGRLVFQMRNNDWIVLPNFEDIESTPSARWLKIRSKKYGVSLDLEFSNKDISEIKKIAESISWNSTLQSVKEYNQNLPHIMPKKEFKDELKKSVSKVIEYVSKNLGEKDIMTCQVNLSINFPVSLQLTPKKLHTKINRSSFIFSGCLMGSATVLSV